MKSNYTSVFNWLKSIIYISVLSLLLEACGSPPGQTNGQATSSQKTPTQATTQSASPSPVQTVPMPSTDTSCPAGGTARAAIMKPLAPGKQQNLVYIYNEVPVHTSTAYGRLLRYNMATGKRTELATSGLALQWAQVSADGRWVLFLSTPDPRLDSKHAALLQLVRMDGQGLQTLYCFPTLPNPNPSPRGSSIQVQWSTDQKSVLFSRETDEATSTVTLLDITSGTLKPELKVIDPTTEYAYRLGWWLDNRRAYVLKEGRMGAPQPPDTLYLLDTQTNKDLQGGDLKQILTQEVRMSSFALDSSFDGSTLVTSYCLKVLEPLRTTISVLPATGGPPSHTYKMQPGLCIDTMRMISSQMLLLLGEKEVSLGKISFHLWKSKQDGTGLSLLTDLPRDATNGGSYSLNRFTQLPWSNVSRDQSQYVLLKDFDDAHRHALLVGSLNGGPLQGVATTTTGSLDIVGWTMMS